MRCLALISASAPECCYMMIPIKLYSQAMITHELSNALLHHKPCVFKQYQSNDTRLASLSVATIYLLRAPAAPQTRSVAPVHFTQDSQAEQPSQVKSS